jgi:hypothetical protein
MRKRSKLKRRCFAARKDFNGSSRDADTVKRTERVY